MKKGWVIKEVLEKEDTFVLVTDAKYRLKADDVPVTVLTDGEVEEIKKLISMAVNFAIFGHDRDGLEKALAILEGEKC